MYLFILVQEVYQQSGRATGYVGVGACERQADKRKEREKKRREGKKRQRLERGKREGRTREGRKKRAAKTFNFYFSDLISSYMFFVALSILFFLVNILIYLYFCMVIFLLCYAWACLAISDPRLSVSLVLPFLHRGLFLMPYFPIDVMRYCDQGNLPKKKSLFAAHGSRR